MAIAIQRRHELDKKINLTNLPKHVHPEEFKDMKWTANEAELLARLERIKALQRETLQKIGRGHERHHT